MKLAWNGPSCEYIVNPDGPPMEKEGSWRPATVATLEDGGSLAFLLSFARGGHYSSELRQLAGGVLAHLEKSDPRVRKAVEELEMLPPADASAATAGVPPYHRVLWRDGEPTRLAYHPTGCLPGCPC